jgi:two-component system, response regulator PdtaR
MTDSKLKILIVEDECIFALDLKFKLFELGYEVTGIATNYRDAVSNAQTYAPDLALMDINIKGPVKGIETAKYLKENYSIPSLFITANSDEETLAKVLELEPLGLMSKPLDELSFEVILHEFSISRSCPAKSTGSLAGCSI